MWLEQDLEEVTTLDHVSNTSQEAVDEFYGKLALLYTGEQISDCLLPCTTTSTDTRLLNEKFINQDSIKLQFSSAVEVRTTFLVQPSLSSFLSSVGGSMGLWLGLGVVQAIELVLSVSAVKCRLQD